MRWVFVVFVRIYVFFVTLDQIYIHVRLQIYSFLWKYWFCKLKKYESRNSSFDIYEYISIFCYDVCDLMRCFIVEWVPRMACIVFCVGCVMPAEKCAGVVGDGDQIVQWWWNCLIFVIWSDIWSEIETFEWKVDVYIDFSVGISFVSKAFQLND